jgi:N6-adenosine-specific RNA methylase IME4
MAPTTLTIDLAIADITVHGRYRREMGDVAALARSIKAIGLLHAVVVTPDKRLIVGARRLEAVKLLGRSTIPAAVVENLDDLASVLKATAEESTCRKDFTPSEAVSLGAAVEAAYRPVAEAKRRDGRNLPASCGKVDRHSRETTAVAATASGLRQRTYEKASKVVASGDEELIAEMDRTGRVDGVYRKLTIATQAEAIERRALELPRGPFDVIVVDPPWRYDKRRGDPSHRGSCPYPTMTVKEIAAMPIEELATKDAVLWLWITNAFLPVVWPIVEAWGFTYKTMLTWGKSKMGTGDWLRGKTEHCLMCVRGKPTINLTNQTTLLLADTRAHSEKPNEFYAMVEALCPGSKLELFQRTPRENWIGHGNECGVS